MIATADSLSPSPAPVVSPSPALLPSSPRRPWKPDGAAHLIYHWVKMEGKSQSWVADALNISQPTVSRTIQRYERWEAHAKAREDGRLDPAERLRAQRWLTFERNELILASCLRIANELEGFIDTSKSTILRPIGRPSEENQVRTELSRSDRTGMTARFLRLAFKINMEQLKLAELDQPPPAPPLTDQELAEEERQAAEDAAEMAAARSRMRGADIPVCQTDAPVESPSVCDDELTVSSASELPASTADIETTKLTRAAEASPTNHSSPRSTSNDLNNSHNLHTENGPKIAAKTDKRCTCAPQLAPDKNLSGPCITTEEPPPWTTADAQHNLVPAAGAP